MHPAYQSFLLFALCVVVLWVSKAANNHTSSSTITQLVGTCEFAPGGAYVEPPYARSNDWCVDSPREPLFALMAHMKLNSQDMDASFGAEFGSMLRIVYVPRLNVFMLNPMVHFEESYAMWLCEDSFGGQRVSQLRPNNVHVSFLRADLSLKSINATRQRIHVTGGDACVIQAIYDRL